MKRILSEPLVHFMLIGAALFAAFSIVSDRTAPSETMIVVTSGKIEHLAAMFTRTWQRPPTKDELQGLIDDFIQEEAAYREGLALGLDRNDIIIRRRIRQKLDFLALEFGPKTEPSDDELASYLAKHSDGFHVDSRLTFRQVFLNADERGDSVLADARQVLDTLRNDLATDASTLGDQLLLEHAYRDITKRDIESLFGQRFGEAIVQIDPGGWQGPIESGYGVHLVFVDERSEGRLPQLDEIRDQVRREWDNARRREAIETFYKELVEKYEISIEWPERDEQDDA
ncbi:MAG: peptidylprolyl isomerase [Planctomycetota bacterium]|nr:peptidylprolyl isomerase [Planctomycetota bacterium]